MNTNKPHILFDRYEGHWLVIAPDGRAGYAANMQSAWRKFLVSPRCESMVYKTFGPSKYTNGVQ